MDHAFSIIVVAMAAFLLPLIAGRARIPAVVLEIVFGIVVVAVTIIILISVA